MCVCVIETESSVVVFFLNEQIKIRFIFTFERLFSSDFGFPMHFVGFHFGMVFTLGSAGECIAWWLSLFINYINLLMAVLFVNIPIA